VSGPRHRTVVPLGAFLVTLGLAWWMTAGAESSPRTTLHRAVGAYHRALEAADLEAAARFVPDDARVGRSEQERRVREWRGTREWGAGRLDFSGDGGEAVVEVRRLEGSGVEVVEKELWRRRGEGAWGLIDWEEVDRGVRRPGRP
jgi:hypothetical protein